MRTRTFRLTSPDACGSHIEQSRSLFKPAADTRFGPPCPSQGWQGLLQSILGPGEGRPGLSASAVSWVGFANGLAGNVASVLAGRIMDTPPPQAEGGHPASATSPPRRRPAW